MALTILGLSGALSHDPSAALYIDGKLIAAVEEERLVRDKHAKNRMPYESAKFCLEQAGITPADVDVVAIPFAPISILEKARWHYAKRYWYAPERALDALLAGNRRFYRYYKKIQWCLVQLGFDLKKLKLNRLSTIWLTLPVPTCAQASPRKLPSWALMVKVSTLQLSLVTVKTARFIRLKSFMILTPWVACMAL